MPHSAARAQRGGIATRARAQALVRLMDRVRRYDLVGDSRVTPSDTSVTKRLRFSTDARLRRRFMVTDEPVQANLRVGLMLEILDKLAEDTALRFVRRIKPDARVVTAAIDELRVRGIPDVTRDIRFKARINFVGKTSMEVGIRIEQVGEQPVHLASCYVTMVARVTNGTQEQGMPLPPLQYARPTDTGRAEKAVLRRNSRNPVVGNEYPTPDEYQLLHRLHLEQDRRRSDLLLAADVVTHGWERTYPEYENVPQLIFGGYVAHRAYMYAHICAEMVATHRALLVSVNRINFYQPVRMGDKLHFLSRATYSGETSLSVETEITRISRDRTMTALSNTCVFTFVNVDADLVRIPVPTVYPTTYLEDARFLAGLRRREAHRARTGIIGRATA
jgi:acyl-coenzyme A thioesterase 9